MEELKHSGLGISSFVVSIVSAVLLLIVFCIVGVLQNTSDGMDDTTTILVGLFVMAFGFISLISLGLGIGALFQSKRKKVFAVLGTIVSALTILGVIGLVIIGLAVSM